MAAEEKSANATSNIINLPNNYRSYSNLVLHSTHMMQEIPRTFNELVIDLSLTNNVDGLKIYSISKIYRYITLGLNGDFFRLSTELLIDPIREEIKDSIVLGTKLERKAGRWIRRPEYHKNHIHKYIGVENGVAHTVAKYVWNYIRTNKNSFKDLKNIDDKYGESVISKLKALFDGMIYYLYAPSAHYGDSFKNVFPNISKLSNLSRSFYENQSVANQRTVLQKLIWQETESGDYIRRYTSGDQYKYNSYCYGCFTNTRVSSLDHILPVFDFIVYFGMIQHTYTELDPTKKSNKYIYIVAQLCIFGMLYANMCTTCNTRKSDFRIHMKVENSDFVLWEHNLVEHILENRTYKNGMEHDHEQLCNYVLMPVISLLNANRHNALNTSNRLITMLSTHRPSPINPAVVPEFLRVNEDDILNISLSISLIRNIDVNNLDHYMALELKSELSLSSPSEGGYSGGKHSNIQEIELFNPPYITLSKNNTRSNRKKTTRSNKNKNKTRRTSNIKINTVKSSDLNNTVYKFLDLTKLVIKYRYYATCFDNPKEYKRINEEIKTLLSKHKIKDFDDLCIHIHDTYLKILESGLFD